MRSENIKKSKYTILGGGGLIILTIKLYLTEGYLKLSIKILKVLSLKVKTRDYTHLFLLTADEWKCQKPDDGY